MEGIGLAHLYPTREWSIVLLAIMDNPRTPDLILRKALRGRLGHQITGATARPFLHLLNPTRRPRQSVKRYKVALYNSRRPHSSLDGMTPDQAYFTQLPLRLAA